METKYFGEFRDVHPKAAGDVHPEAVSETHPQSEQKEAHPAEKYIGRSARCGWGGILDVVGYAVMPGGSFSLIVDCSPSGGWSNLGPSDVVFKECKSYWYVSVGNLID